MPNASIGVDVIVGLTETHDIFLDTYNFLNNLNVSYFHVLNTLTENTISCGMSDKVSEKDKVLKVKFLRFIFKKKSKFYKNNLNKSHNILWESENRGYIHGLSSNYIRLDNFGIHHSLILYKTRSWLVLTTRFRKS